MYLARGGQEWQPELAAQVLRLLPALQRLQFRFAFDDEHPPTDLLGTLLSRQASMDAASVAAAAEAGVALLQTRDGGLGTAPVLASLRHLALIHPPRSVIPPTAHLPDALSTMTQARVRLGGNASCPAPPRAPPARPPPHPPRAPPPHLLHPPAHPPSTKRS